MLRIVAYKEIISNLLSYKFFIAVLLITVLIFTSFFVMYKDYKNRMADYHLTKPTSEDPIAQIPPNPLSIFAKGLDDAMGRSFEINRIGIDVREGQRSGNVFFSFFTAPDFLYVIRVMMSLVALLFGFDQISRERERGTLRMMLSNPISRAKILTGKWTGNFLSLSVPFILVSLLGVLLMSLDPDIHFSSSDLARLFMILTVTLIYIAFFLNMGILVSALTRKAAVTIVILLFVWVVLVFVLPNMGTLLARQVVDVPSVAALSEKRQQIWTREVLLAIEESRIGKTDWESHYRKSHDEMDKLESEYRNRFNRLIRLSKNINRISPVASYIYAVTEIAGTGIGEEGHLKQSVLSYKNSILPEVMRRAPEGESKQYTVFQYRYRSLSQIFVQGVLFDTSWLIFFNILFFVLSYFALVKYDVR